MSEFTSEIIYTDRLAGTLNNELAGMDTDKVFVLTDSNVAKALPADVWPVADRQVITPGEGSKSLLTARGLWRWLTEAKATRHSVLVNIGGGVITDLGGFVAATFKRGIRFVNVPTSLLAIADASVGGKTGIDFMGYKNEIGVFAAAVKVVIAPEVLRTLPETELRSGFAEVVKMALITGDEIYEKLQLPDALHDEEIMTTAIRHAVEGKLKIVNEDFRESGHRRVLNFGHTAGHAYEIHAARIGRPISHGEAVAHGMFRALQLSHERNGYPAHKVREYKEKILDRYYQPLPFGPEAEEQLVEIMLHDKKNANADQIGWVLLPADDI